MALKSTPLVGGIAALVGTAVGAGVFGIPHVFAKAGVALGTVHLVVLSAVTVVTLLAYAQVIVQTKGVHQFAGYAEEYLGKGGKYTALLSLVFGIYGAMVAYVMEVGHFLFVLLGGTFGGSEKIYALIFWALASMIVIIGLSMVVKIEQILVIAIVLIVLLFVAFGLPYVKPANLSGYDLSKALLPYGVILFALSSATVLPEIRRYLVKRRKLEILPKVIVLGVGLAAVLYWLFATITVGITGLETSESAVDGLGQVLGSEALGVGAIFAVLAMGSSFLVLGLSLKQMYQYDFKQSKIIAALLTLLVPLLVYLANLVSFIEIIGIVGSITGGFIGIIIWRMYHKAIASKVERKTEFKINIPIYVGWVAELVFVFGVIYEVLRILGAFG